MRRGLLPSLEQAEEAVAAGKVLVSGSIAAKSSRLVGPGEPIELAGDPMPYVSRGGVKLAAALDAFGIDVSGYRCLDVGASTGGFTDCLLQRGATTVVAVDVGRGQLDWSLRNDARVEVLERTDVREADDPGRVDLVVCDVSFISLRTVMPSLVRLASGTPLVVLVKPQFEVGRRNVGKGGVVRDPALHTEAVDGVVAAAEAHGLHAIACCRSPIEGAEGNREFFVYIR